MIGVDTNVLVRLLVNDDKKQASSAANLFGKNHIFISKTVLLECEWVLRACYGFISERIAEAFKNLLNVSSITVEESSRVAFAIMLYQKGMDFGDAVHIVSSASAKKFISFDKKLVKKANKLHIQQVSLIEEEG